MFVNNSCKVIYWLWTLLQAIWSWKDIWRIIFDHSHSCRYFRQSARHPLYYLYREGQQKWKHLHYQSCHCWFRCKYAPNGSKHKLLKKFDLIEHAWIYPPKGSFCQFFKGSCKNIRRCFVVTAKSCSSIYTKQPSNAFNMFHPYITKKHTGRITSRMIIW